MSQSDIFIILSVSQQGNLSLETKTKVCPGTEEDMTIDSDRYRHSSTVCSPDHLFALLKLPLSFLGAPMTGGRYIVIGLI